METFLCDLVCNQQVAWDLPPVTLIQGVDSTVSYSFCSFHWTMSSKPDWATKIDLDLNTDKKGNLDVSKGAFILLSCRTNNEAEQGCVLQEFTRESMWPLVTSQFLLTLVCAKCIGLFHLLKNQAYKRSQRTTSLLPYTLGGWGNRPHQQLRSYQLGTATPQLNVPKFSFLCHH